MVHKLGVTLEELYSGKKRKLAANRCIIIRKPRFKLRDF